MRLPFLCASLLLAVASCGVPKTQYDAALAEKEKTKADCDAKFAAAEASRNQDATALKSEIERLRAKLAEAEGKAAASSEATRAELDELRRQKVAAEARLKLFEDFLSKFKKMIEAGKLDIAVRRGQIVLVLGTDILFDTGKTEIKPDGRAALAEVAEALKGVSGRRFQVAGHTDTLPIKTKEFPSNWELSTARAVAVVKLITEKGVRADALSAAGYAEFDPAQPNANERGRAKNRRIEIVIVPSVEDLVKMPEIGRPKDASAAEPKEPAAPAPKPKEPLKPKK